MNPILRLLSESEKVAPTGVVKLIVAVLSVCTCVVVSWLALFGTVTEHLQIAWFLVFMLPLSYLTASVVRGVHRLTILEYGLAALAAASGAYFVWNDSTYSNWIISVSELNTLDYVFGTALIVMSVDLCRRTVGIGLTVVLAVLLAYVVFGSWLPGSFRHDPLTYHYFVEMQTATQDGIFGSPLYVTASYAFLFVLFGNFFMLAGGGQLFFDLAAAVTGRMVGGPAKACVTSSGLYGMISGSPVADVATTGPISIPIMRRLGISAERAGAIEAAASAGGGILPPVMGAVAFIMADFTGIPYGKIALYAMLPAIGYYVGVFALVHFEARRLGLERLPESDIVGLRIALARNWPSIIPIATLIWLLVAGYSAAYVAAGAAGAVIVSSWVKRANAIGPRRFVEGCVETCLSIVPLIGAVAAAGMIIGCIELTGLAGKFTLLIFELSGGLMVPTLVLSAVVLILLGMGMPTTGVYIMGVALLAPVLMNKFGLPKMEVHMFMLFFSCMSAITPPVAVAAFAAAMIAKANAMRIGFNACQLAIGGFLLPFYFIFNNGILFQGGALDILSDTIVGWILVISASVALYGSAFRNLLNPALRVVFAALALGMMYPLRPLQWGLVACAVALFLLLRARSAAPATATAR